uniref:Uncharacterized protein n=1 Tax=Knipowitschia caucasica TaxID=637954 RepID=A0AAV2JC77_KNICA
MEHMPRKNSTVPWAPSPSGLLAPGPAEDYRRKNKFIESVPQSCQQTLGSWLQLELGASSSGPGPLSQGTQGTSSLGASLGASLGSGPSSLGTGLSSLWPLR